MIDATLYPPVIAVGDGYRKRAAFSYSLDGAWGCCIEALMADHEADALDHSTVSVCRCGHAWACSAGTWRIVGTAERKPVRGGRVLAIGRGTDCRIRGAK